jgi:hypothetical protein
VSVNKPLLSLANETLNIELRELVFSSNTSASLGMIELCSKGTRNTGIHTENSLTRLSSYDKMVVM